MAEVERFNTSRDSEGNMPTGWISKRAFSGDRIGGTKGMKLSDKGPLRKISYTITYAASMFDKAWVKFECGHEGYASGRIRGRCIECKTIA